MVAADRLVTPAPGTPIPTFCAPPERLASVALNRQVRDTVDDPIVRVILAAVEGYVLVLNRHRQILAANREILEALGLAEMDSLQGTRSGEAMGCEHASEGPGGCGTSEHCRTCGAVLAILATQDDGEPHTGECCMTVLRGGEPTVREFRVRTSSLEVAGEKLLCLVMRDVTEGKRREALERVFFHDLGNTLHGLLGWGDLLKSADPEVASRHIVRLSEQLTDVVEGQRILLRAEHGELRPDLGPVPVGEVLLALAEVFHHPCGPGPQRLRFRGPAVAARVQTDKALLLRVLVNMVKNALEATTDGTPVDVSCEVEVPQGLVMMAVRNPGVLDAEVVPHIFQRSFSTKGDVGRGLGTYSMKLLGERYLGGKVSFRSSPSLGTEFSVVLPLAPD